MEVKDVDLGDAPVSILPLPAELVIAPNSAMEHYLEFLDQLFGQRFEHLGRLSLLLHGGPKSHVFGVPHCFRWPLAAFVMSALYASMVAASYFLAEFFALEQQFEAKLRGNDQFGDLRDAG